MKIVIPGGTGQVGALLARAFYDTGDEVIVVSRSPRPAPWRVEAWDGQTLTGWTRSLEGADAVINLAGRSVNCRYTEENRREIKASRLSSTRAVAEAIARAKRPPAVWLQASTATIYAHRFDAANDEDTGILGGEEPDAPDTWRFSIDVAKTWERAFDEAVVPGTRKIKLRSAILMTAKPGGAFDILLRLVRLGLGGQAGDGRQYVSWIHGEDFVAAIRWIIARSDFAGPVNVASPNPLPNAAFMRALRQAWRVPLGVPATSWMLEAGAFFLRTETELILKSRRVVPTRLLREGFSFQFPDWPEAAKDLCRRWRDEHGSRRTP